MNTEQKRQTIKDMLAGKKTVKDLTFCIEALYSSYDDEPGVFYSDETGLSLTEEEMNSELLQLRKKATVVLHEIKTYTSKKEELAA